MLSSLLFSGRIPGMSNVGHSLMHGNFVEDIWDGISGCSQLQNWWSKKKHPDKPICSQERKCSPCDRFCQFHTHVVISSSFVCPCACSLWMHKSDLLRLNPFTLEFEKYISDILRIGAGSITIFHLSVSCEKPSSTYCVITLYLVRLQGKSEVLNRLTCCV